MIQKKDYLEFDYTAFEFKAKLQKNPIKEVGVNGCQIDEVILFAKDFIEALNGNYPCRENSLAITKLDEALMWLEKRKKDREKRGVEGYNKL